MKINTSIVLSDDVLAAVDAAAGAAGNRSAVIERVLRDHFARQGPAQAARELDALNRRAAALNAEAADVLEYQAAWPDR